LQSICLQSLIENQVGYEFGIVVLPPYLDNPVFRGLAKKSKLVPTAGPGDFRTLSHSPDPRREYALSLVARPSAHAEVHVCESSLHVGILHGRSVNTDCVPGRRGSGEAVPSTHPKQRTSDVRKHPPNRSSGLWAPTSCAPGQSRRASRSGGARR